MIHYRSEVRAGGANGRALAATARALLRELGEGDAELSLTLVDDATIRRLNKQYRKKDKPTDVLSFPQREHVGTLREPPTFSQKSRTTNSFGVAKKRRSRSNHGRLRRASREGSQHAPDSLLGDVVISVETAQRQAAAYDAPLQRELERLLIHGLLHLLGHDHHEAGERRRMEAEERRLAQSIGMPWPYEREELK